MPRESLPSEVIRPDPDPAASAPTAALVVPPGPAALALGSGEIRQFATELATQLFARWELALQEQFRAELGLRLEAELEHREREAGQLREEVRKGSRGLTTRGSPATGLGGTRRGRWRTPSDARPRRSPSWSCR